MTRLGDENPPVVLGGLIQRACAMAGEGVSQLLIDASHNAQAKGGLARTANGLGAMALPLTAAARQRG